LPITYLGIPLTVRKPTAAQLQPVVDRVAAKLPTWKAGLMDRAGRLVMVKSVLGAIPIHQLLVIAPDKRTIKLITKIQRGFLWAGRAAANGGHCHVNWQRVARPLSLGGLGVHDLERTSLALRLRWLWLSRTDNRRAWHGLDLQFTAAERSLFFASTTMTVGNGLNALFWEDRWLGGRSISEIAPQLYACVPKRRRKGRTVANGMLGHNWARDIHGVVGLHEIGQYLTLWRMVDAVVLSEAQDQLVWKWTPSGTYTARSAYLATFQGSIPCPAWKHTWKAWAPPRVKLFHWLAYQNRCWTADRLANRGLQHHARCLLCDQEPETMRHLLIECSFTKQIWHEALAWLRIPCRPPEDADASIFAWLDTAKRSAPKPMRKGLGLLRCWCHGWFGSTGTTASSSEGGLRSPTLCVTSSARLGFGHRRAPPGLASYCQQPGMYTRFFLAIICNPPPRRLVNLFLPIFSMK
jgi:hypothetical protein